MTDSFDIRNSTFGICPVPPRGNANFALSSLPHSAFRLRTLKCLTPHGMAGFVLANGSMSSHQSGDCNARAAKAALLASALRARVLPHFPALRYDETKLSSLKEVEFDPAYPVLAKLKAVPEAMWLWAEAMRLRSLATP